MGLINFNKNIWSKFLNEILFFNSFKIDLIKLNIMILFLIMEVSNQH